LLAAWGSWLFARQAAGEWLVRIEDLDPLRERTGVAAQHLRSLADLGMQSDVPVVWQSARGQHYRAALDRLVGTAQAFECHCSRTDLAAAGGIHHQCVGVRTRAETAIRFRVEPGAHVVFDDLIHGPMGQDVGAEVGDFVLRRADGFWAYQLAVVVDDADQGITDVVRGADLLDSTPRQILLQRALGLPTPRHAHLPLLLDGAGRKLSKSLHAAALDTRDPLPALRLVWAALGQPPRALVDAGSLDALLATAIREFDPARVPVGPRPAPDQTPA
jgi:glutamyl-Q tRNA(Asp) synthetase